MRDAFEQWSDDGIERSLTGRVDGRNVERLGAIAEFWFTLRQALPVRRLGAAERLQHSSFMYSSGSSSRSPAEPRRNHDRVWSRQAPDALSPLTLDFSGTASPSSLAQLN